MALKVVGSTPTNYPMVKNFIKKIFKKKIFKKKIKYFVKIQNNTYIKLFLKKLFLKKLFLDNNFLVKSTIFIFNLNQKNYNTKSTITTQKTLNTFSVGSVIKYFNLKQGKSTRRNIKGIKIFLNFLKNILEKRYNFNKNFKYIYQINSFDYNIFFLKKFFLKIIQKNPNNFILFKISISFTKKKNPKKKSIKKRITKSILINFLKNNKQFGIF